MKTNKWVNNYLSLNRQQQLEVLEAIIGTREKTGEHQGDELDRFRIIKEFLNEIIAEYSSPKSRKRLTLLERFDNLPEETKKKAANEIIKIIEDLVKKQNLEKAKKTCIQEGHIFGDWKKVEYTTCSHPVVRKHSFYDHNGYLVEETDRTYRNNRGIKWVRECRRCGHKENSFREPDEVIQAILEEKRQEEIKQLENRLKELKKKK